MSYRVLGATVAGALSGGVGGAVAAVFLIRGSCFLAGATYVYQDGTALAAIVLGFLGSLLGGFLGADA